MPVASTSACSGTRPPSTEPGGGSSCTRAAHRHAAAHPTARGRGGGSDVASMSRRTPSENASAVTSTTAWDPRCPDCTRSAGSRRRPRRRRTHRSQHPASRSGGSGRGGARGPSRPRCAGPCGPGSPAPRRGGAAGRRSARVRRRPRSHVQLRHEGPQCCRPRSRRWPTGSSGRRCTTWLGMPEPASAPSRSSTAKATSTSASATTASGSAPMHLAAWACRRCGVEHMPAVAPSRCSRGRRRPEPSSTSTCRWERRHDHPRRHRRRPSRLPVRAPGGASSSPTASRWWPSRRR